MVPSYRIFQNVGSRKSESDYLRKKIIRIKTKCYHDACHFNSVKYFLLAQKNMRKTSMVEPFSWLCYLNIELLFIAFMTGRMFQPRIALKIGRFGPRFQWSKCRSIFWTEIRRIFDQFVLPLFSARTFLPGELAVLKSGIFLNSNISIRIFTIGIANLFDACECRKIDEPNIENRIVIDRSEAEKYEFIHESCVFSKLFFQPNKTWGAKIGSVP